ncbi:MAG: NADH-quinone oxidoreductase subunit C [Eubacteriales bacterium]|nr:NADH-quinone oxidoreductase subunit C [Eubacteriales bacterium]
MQPYKKFDVTKEEIVPTAERMRKAGVPLVMIHGLVNAEGANVVSYEYGVDKGVESYQVTFTDDALPSVSPIYAAAAAWPEKELEELMGIQFAGLDMPGRLFLPENLIDDRGHIIVTPLSELREHRHFEDAQEETAPQA